MIRALILALLLSACGKEGKPDVKERPDLRAQYQTYLALNKGQMDQDGFVMSGDCDSLLFSSLNAIGRNEEFNIQAAEIEPGKWYRNQRKDGCDSSISRDMLMGVMAYSLYFKRLDIAQDLWHYGEAHNWKMGYTDSGNLEFEARTIMSPGQVALLAQVIHHLGGPDYAIRFTPQVFTAEVGFAGHLTLLHFWMIDRMEGELGPIVRKVLTQYRTIAPNNAFVSYLYNKYNGGSQQGTVELLNRYPVDRLPTGSDWCEAWLQQRVGTEDQQGQCSDKGPWNGGDFLFIANPVLGLHFTVNYKQEVR